MPAFIAALSGKVDCLDLIFASEFKDTQKVAGLGLAISIYVMLKKILTGITTPIETLTSNAYGNGDLKLCGLYLYRTLIVALGAYTTVGILYFYLVYYKQILLRLGQDAEVLHYMNEYLFIAIPAFALRVLNDMLRRWLNQMKLTQVPMIAYVISALVYVPAAYYLAIH